MANEAGEQITPREWVDQVVAAGFDIFVQEEWDYDDKFSGSKGYRISLSPLQRGTAWPEGFYVGWYESEPRAKLYQLLLALPGEEMVREEDEQSRDFEEEIGTWNWVSSEQQWWARGRVTVGYWEQVKELVEQLPAIRSIALDEQFDRKVSGEISADPRIQILRERQAQLAAEEEALRASLRAEKEAHREDFRYVAEPRPEGRGI